MNFELRLINKKMGKNLYDMYQDIPKEEIGSINKFYGCTMDDFYEYIDEIKKEEKIMNINLNTTTNRYIFFVDDYPVGEIGIRTTFNDFWVNRGSQIFYKIRVGERNKGYGTKMLELALEECKKLGMKKVRINCDDNNIASRNVIEKNGGLIDIKSYQTKNGYSSSFIIELK